MNQLLTFTWSTTIYAPNGFDPDDEEHISRALTEAWAQLQRSDGELTNTCEEPDDIDPETLRDFTSGADIKATCSSDDRAINIDFDATAWFEQASEDEIMALADCDWGGHYPADKVAYHYRQAATKDLFDYVETLSAYQNGNDQIGFECHVDQDDVMVWLQLNRVSLQEKIVAQKYKINRHD